MPFLHVSITRFADKNFPGFVECQFLDANGVTRSFEEKIPVVTTEDLWIDSEYPQPGFVECAVVNRREDESQRIFVVLGALSLDAEDIFEVFAEQLIDHVEGFSEKKA